jgi:hypothetical protein
VWGKSIFALRSNMSALDFVTEPPFAHSSAPHVLLVVEMSLRNI